ncbi:hypothetical protein B0T17DRAFT_597609 [Bombardia bombarda]|uniref:EGF domain-specific O-linked N-acetylglucosamine transferase n=1 Tax=Bombardia bombarda TaxID=252184 RepID=A0AA39X897_9PEZI|nr:hypothetical protein B0T17DRAFT_597609 [Bombardia bombarda]
MHDIACHHSLQLLQRDVRITFVDRQASRHLLNASALFAALQTKVPHISVAMFDFAALSMPEQLRIVHQDTDILVGVHGAGLTHQLFMRPGSAVVELQPNALVNAETGTGQMGYRNMAMMMGLDYFRIHVDVVGEIGGREGGRGGGGGRGGRGRR